MISRFRYVVAMACMCTALASCGGPPPPLDAAQTAPLKGGYPLAAGDKLRVTVFDEPTLTGEYNVTSQGTIAFPLIGAVPADGKSTEELGATIRTMLSKGYIKDPRVSIEVLNYRPYYILGEINKPGEYIFTNGLTVEQAIAAAGGFTYRANRRKIFLRRRNTVERTVDLRNMSVQVLPGDTIRIGERYF